MAAERSTRRDDSARRREPGQSSARSDSRRRCARRCAASRRAPGRGWTRGARFTPSETISIAEHSGIVAYVPGDLTMTVRGGTTLAEIRDATAPHNQWLALDPHGSDERNDRRDGGDRVRRTTRDVLRNTARPRARRRIRVRHGHGRARRWTRREERRGLRPHALDDRIVGHARRRHRGHGAAACEARGSTSHSRSSLAKRMSDACAPFSGPSRSNRTRARSSTRRLRARCSGRR